VIFCVEDNGYAISVPVEVNTPGGNISRLVANFPNFYFAEVDGTDPDASFQAFKARWSIAARVKGRRLCMGTACGFIRTPSRRTTSITG
jgi:2-oxoisovalerate dehydrogenase E1 component